MFFCFVFKENTLRFQFYMNAHWEDWDPWVEYQSRRTPPVNTSVEYEGYVRGMDVPEVWSAMLPYIMGVCSVCAGPVVQNINRATEEGSGWYEGRIPLDPLKTRERYQLISSIQVYSFLNCERLHTIYKTFYNGINAWNIAASWET